MDWRAYFILFAGHLAFACGQYDAPLTETFSDSEAAVAGVVSPSSPVAFAEEAVPARRAAASSQAPSAPQQRKVIRHGNLSLEVESVEKALSDVKQLVESREGYISNESVSEDPYSRKSGSISCRIPSESLDELISQIEKLGKVDSLSVAADDITDQYYDLEIRIGNQKKLETRLLALLERQTNKLSDLLEIEREVARVRTQIDTMEGRKRLWDNQVAYSTLVVNLKEPLPAIAGEEGGALRTLLRSFGQAGNNFVLTVAGLIAASGAVVPVALVVGFAVWLSLNVMRRRRGRTDKEKAKAEAKDEENRSEK